MEQTWDFFTAAGVRRGLCFETNLPDPALVLYGDRLMVSVFRLGAELAHAPLLVPAEHLQQPPVLLAYSVGEVPDRGDHLVKPQAGDPLVRLQVCFAVRGHAHQAGLEGFHLQGSGSTDVAHHLARRGRRRRRGPRRGDHVPEDLGQLLEGGVDAQLRPDAVGPPAGGADAGLAAVPRCLDAGLAEVMAARSGDGVDERLLADGAVELFFQQDSHGGHGPKKHKWKQEAGEGKSTAEEVFGKC